MNKLINSPNGADGEYASYAMSFYECCMEPEGQCKYCYMKAMANRFGSYFGKARLKEWLKDEENAFQVFRKEFKKHLPNLQKHGLFFNFSSDPGLPISLLLNNQAWEYCYFNNVKVIVLTKQTWWIDDFIERGYWENAENGIVFGFTITGSDDQEPGAPSNIDRIESALKLHNAGFKLFGSFEPAIDLDRTYEMIFKTIRYDCIDLYKIGLLSGKKYDKEKLLKFLSNCLSILGDKKVYFKDSLLIQSGINRADLPKNCVDRSFNL